MIKHTIDATDQSIGRMATQIALLLRGKLSPSYMPHLLPEDKVSVSNIRKARFTGNKLENKKYFHYSGYPGGMKERTLENVFAKNPQRVLWLAVYRMLPKNKTRDKIIKNLDIK